MSPQPKFKALVIAACAVVAIGSGVATLEKAAAIEWTGAQTLGVQVSAATAIDHVPAENALKPQV